MKKPTRKKTAAELTAAELQALKREIERLHAQTAAEIRRRFPEFAGALDTQKTRTH